MFMVHRTGKVVLLSYEIKYVFFGITILVFKILGMFVICNTLDRGRKWCSAIRYFNIISNYIVEIRDTICLLLSNKN